ncbi:PAS domain S-box-containing protein/diguanylate cyclase (GGDEF) domain-containing protein [Anaerocolumna jejuensis DSM 15929]|uniref:PAS domain S-box-containing protein/diguanylate cyclase (GGDEF) domain-containing protein n=1 Tax=Anaerocolumna jejuensis DSM 15929 TaxID=1121322 RepID=A0A1M6LVZ6_9FIRM|nr:diguanylate cyclase [Anaerocolumna jejuensis]SHJ75340.1 PAS domain S-box-containing protein/diguanylate cyclase (GGDEF) domain-containing protein [Anaerocolumna jejuensis DSM 15929]
MSYILSFLSMIAGVVYLVVGVTTYTLNKKSTIGKAFLLLTASMALWSFSYSHAYVTENIYIFGFWNKLSAFGWCLFPALTLYMVFALTKDRFLDSTLKCALLFAPAALFCYMDLFVFFPGKPYSHGAYRFFQIANPVYSYAYTLIGIVKLVLWQHNTPYKIVKKQARIILSTAICTYLLSMAGEFLVPLFIPGFLNCTQVFGVIMILGIYCAIRKYNFLLTPNELIVNELFEETMDFEFLVNLKGMITRVNRQVLKTLGYSLEDLASVSFEELLREEKGKRFSEWLNEDNIKTKHCKNVTIRTKAGENITVNMSIVPISNSRNELVLGYLIIAQDIRAMEELKREMESHQETMRKLRNSEELFRTVTQTIPYGIICSKRSDKAVFYVNKYAEVLFERDFNSIININAELLYHNKAFRDRLLELVRKEGQAVNQVGIMRRPTGEFLAMVSMAPAIYKGEEVVFGCISDITEQNRLKKDAVKSEEMLNKLMDSIPDLVMVTDIEGNINYCSKNIESFLGYSTEQEGFPKNILDILDFLEEGKEKAFGNRLPEILHNDINIIQTTYKRKDGKVRIAEIKASALKDEDKEAFGYVFVARDITEYKRKEEKLARRKAEVEEINKRLLKSNEVFKEKAVKDSLTNLYNHEYIITLLKREIKKQRQEPKGLAVMMMDIDYFKKVNDTYGHQAGDKVLIKISEIIQESIGENDYAGRYGGEEFLVILREGQTEDTALKAAERMKERISNCIFENNELRVTISIGLVLHDGESTHELIKKADKLLYQAKYNGRSRIERSMEHDN